VLRHPRPGACRSALSASRPFLASAHAPEGVLLRASAHTSECVLLGPVGTAALSPVSPRARGRVCSGLRHTRPSACCSALSVLRLFFTSAHAPEGVLLRASACTAEYLLRCLVGAAALSHFSPRARGRVAPGFGVHGRVLVARPCRCCGSFSRQPTRQVRVASAHAPEGVLLRASACTAEYLLRCLVGAAALSHVSPAECLLLGLVGAAALSHVSPRARGRVAPGFGVHGRVLVARPCRCCGSFSRQPTRPSACCSGLSALRLLPASAHAPEGGLLRAPAHAPGCVLLCLVGVAAPSRVSPRARGRVCSGLRHTRPSACCSALSVLRLFLTSAHAPEGVLLRASACTAECLLLGLVGAAALSHVSPTRPRACCSGLRRARPSACCSAVSVLRLFLASAHAPKCVLLGLVGVAAPSRVVPRARGHVAPGSGARARVRVARPCRRCGSFPRQPTRRRACCSGLRPTSPSACCSGLSALTPSLVAWDCRHCAERLFLASDRPPGRGARVCWRCGAFSVRCCRRGCGLA